MLNLWIRSQPVQSTYRCVSCDTVVSRGTTRRPSVVAGPWCLQFKHLTTLFYASIITTAAAADAAAKKTRREQWIEAITRAERDIQALKNMSASRRRYTDDVSAEEQDEAEVRRHDSGRNEVDELLNGVPTTGEDDLERRFAQDKTNRVLPDVEIELRRLRQTQTFSDGFPRRWPLFDDYTRVAPISIYASTFRKHNFHPTWTAKKLVTLELSVAKLTTRMLLKSLQEFHSRLGVVGPTKQQVPSTLGLTHLQLGLADIEARLARMPMVDADNPGELESVDYPRYTPNDTNWEEAVEPLNRAIIQLLRRHANGHLDLEETLSKLSYNLLISEAPPDMKTYTILISRLSRLRYHELADMVIESMTESHIRPNEVTVSAIIVHHRRKGDFEGFDRFIQKIEGSHSGLMLAHRKTPVEGVGASRLRRLDNGKIVQLIVSDMQIYTDIINTYLRFDKFDMAMKWYGYMRRDRHEPEVPLLITFLRYFQRKADWQRGYGIWQNIRSHLVGPDGSRSIHVDVLQERRAYYFMLQFCKRCQRPKAFKEVYQDALIRGLPMNSILMRNPGTRGFSVEDDITQHLKMQVRALKRRADLIRDSLAAWSIRVLASKIILSGFDLTHVRQAFENHADENAFQEWLAERPWLWKRGNVYCSKRVPLGGYTAQIAGVYRLSFKPSSPLKRPRSGVVALADITPAQGLTSSGSSNQARVTSLSSSPNMKNFLISACGDNK